MLSEKELLNILDNKEKVNVEFKEAKRGVPKSIYETYSSFANTNGGLIILGVKEIKTGTAVNYEISGVENANSIISDFWNTINSGKVNRNILKDADVYSLTVQGLELVILHIPRALYNQKPIYTGSNPYAGTFKRNFEGDYRCTKESVNSMIRDSFQNAGDNEILEWLNIGDLDKNTIAVYRTRFRNNNEGHIYEELSDKELLSIEKEMLGIYISGHPLEKIRHQIEMQTNINTIEMKKIDEQNSSQFDMENMSQEKSKYVDGQKVKYAGIITSIKKKYTKNNKIMAFVTVEDLYGQAEIIVFENAYINSSSNLVEENIVMVEGRLSIREDEETKIVANEIKKFGEQKQKVLILDITGIPEKEKSKLRGAIKYFKGDRNNINVFVKVGEDNAPCGAIYCNDEILKVFEDIIGKTNVKLEDKSF